MQFQQRGALNEHGNQALLSILLDMVTQLWPPWVCDEIVFSCLFTSSAAAEGNSCMSLIHCVSVISTPLKWCTKFSLWIPVGRQPWFHRKVIGTNAMVGKHTQFRKTYMPKATIQHVRKQRISRRDDSKRQGYLMRNPFIFTFNFHFLSLIWHYLKCFPILSGRKKLCLSVIFNWNHHKEC